MNELPPLTITPFGELLLIYPKITPNGRRLQNNKDKVEKKYNSHLKNNLDLHKKILNCVKAEIKDRLSHNSENYWKMLSTYVNQKGWELYEADLEEPNKKELRHGHKFA